ncbi:MAG: hypothetical protein ACT4O5_14395 [Gammaproteobacteria bacterium]
MLQSGSFAFSDIGTHRRGAVFDPMARFVNEFRARPGEPASRMYLSCGVYESLIYENRTMLPLLQDLGVEVKYEEVRDGHNWVNWRDRARTGLSWLFPGRCGWFTSRVAFVCRLACCALAFPVLGPVPARLARRLLALRASTIVAAGLPHNIFQISAV